MKANYLYKQPTVVIDDFFECPNQVRHWGLSLEFFKGNRGNWPGFRTELLHKVDMQFHQLLCQKIIKHTEYNGFRQFDCSFHICDESWGDGWIHTDPLHFNVVGLIYLNPNPPTDDHYGTIIYDQPIEYDMGDGIFNADVNELDSSARRKWDKEREHHNAHYKPNTIVDNRYNRCIIFDARQWHSAGKFFGKEGDKENSRLTIVFFGEAVV